LSVSEAAELIGGAIRSGVPDAVRVIGQISGFRDRTHWYFDLKDEDAVLGCVMFASRVKRSGLLGPGRSDAVVGNGLEVVVRGRVEYYTPSGRVSLIVDRIEPVGAGALELAFRALCEQLRALGWFDEARKRPLPRMAGRVAVVTSAQGAAVRDVIETARKRCPMVELMVVDVRVQGERAVGEIVAALDELGKRHGALGIDAVVLTRGGGSMEDLWAFNSRDVAEAIVRSPVPVVAAIGHESDTTIAELVADRRCSTPTQAAVVLVPDGVALDRELDDLSRRLRHGALRTIEAGRSRTRALSARGVMRDPSGLVARARARVEAARVGLAGSVQRRVSESARRVDGVWVRLERHRPETAHARHEARLDALSSRLRRAGLGVSARAELDGLASRLRRATMVASERMRGRLEAAGRELEAVGPMSVLARGYSVTLRSDGSAVRADHEVRPGERIETRLAAGVIRSVVEGEEEGKGVRSEPASRASRGRRRSRREGDDGNSSDPERGQMDLFG